MVKNDETNFVLANFETIDRRTARLCKHNPDENFTKMKYIIYKKQTSKTKDDLLFYFLLSTLLYLCTYFCRNNEKSKIGTTIVWLA